MADAEHVARLKQGVEAWNRWREENPKVEPDLTGAYLPGANLWMADLSRANLHKANLNGAILRNADLTGVDLRDAGLITADLVGAQLIGADLTEATLFGAILIMADLTRADLTGVNLTDAILNRADCTNATLRGCRVHGASAWNMNLGGAVQQNLVITDQNEPEITVDSIEVAQFVYLLLHNPKIRDVIDIITSKAVLILGRFTSERKAVLDALREELRRHDYVPILFDFEGPTSQNTTATVLTLARLARFIIADLTDPSSIPYEIGRIVPSTKVPVQPILLSNRREFAMFRDLQDDYHWVLPIQHYDTQEQLIREISARVIEPAERKAADLRAGTT